MIAKLGMLYKVRFEGGTDYNGNKISYKPVIFLADGLAEAAQLADEYSQKFSNVGKAISVELSHARICGYPKGSNCDLSTEQARWLEIGRRMEKLPESVHVYRLGSGRWAVVNPWEDAGGESHESLLEALRIYGYGEENDAI